MTEATAHTGGASPNKNKKNVSGPDGKRFDGYRYDPNDLVIIGLDTDDGPEHHLYDKRINLPLDDKMVLNVMALGVLENVLLQRDGDRLVVLAGRQRVRWAREANIRNAKLGAELVLVPGVIKRATDAMALSITIAENEARIEDTLESKLPKLEKLLALGKSEEECAIIFAVTLQTIKNWCTLMEAHSSVIKAIQKGLLSATAGVKIAGLQKSEQAAAVEEATKDGKASVVKAERVARQKKKNKTEGTDEKAFAPPSKRLLRKLVDGPDFQMLDVDALQVLKWVLGDVSTDRIKGLTAVVRKIEEGKDE